MGQCSTLPSEANNSNNNHNASTQASSSAFKARYRQGMTESSDNSATPLTQYHHAQQHQPQTRGYTTHVQTGDMVQLPPRPQQQQQQPPPNSPFGAMPPNPQHRQSPNSNVPQPMQEEREPVPSTPEVAIRQRCYKLNLESEYVGIHAASTPRQEGQIFGPFADYPPPLTYSGSDDSSTGTNPTHVAIQTAQIFRGITVAKDGTILSQNARATRSNRNSKTKRGEKSRQAAKIDQAKDLVDEAVMTGRTADDKEAQMVSLIIVGEYDEMKQLVRDGSKKLRDATGLPDDSLLAVNRPRGTISPVMSPSRKRVSPYALASSSPHSVNSNPLLSPTSNKARHMAATASVVPPKLKGHPRDPSRRGPSNGGGGGLMDDGRPNSRRGFSPIHDPCHDMFETSLGLTRGFNSIWNCGGNVGSGTMNSTQHVNDQKGYSTNVVTPQPRKPIVEARHDSSYRGMRTSERIEAPPQHQAAVNA